MAKITSIIIFLIVVGGGLVVWDLLKKPAVNAPAQQNQTILPSVKKPMAQTKKVLLIIAHKGFKDEEYFGTRQALDDAHFQVTVASDIKGTAQGAAGNEVIASLSLQDVNAADYDAIVFIGGPGALEHLDNQVSYKIAQSALKENKIVAAICISPVILAKAGVLKGKNATVWTSPLDKAPAKILEQNSAHYLNQPVVEDGQIITGNGPSAAKEFGEKIAQTLQSQ